jgi:hypothetical protein
MAKELGLEFQQKQEIFLLSITFRLALGPTQESVDWIHLAQERD